MRQYPLWPIGERLGPEVSLPSELVAGYEYSTEQILKIVEVYGRVVHTAANMDMSHMGSPGSPNNGIGLEVLLRVKKQADTLPKQIRERFPQPFDEIENAIGICQENEKRRHLFVELEGAISIVR